MLSDASACNFVMRGKVSDASDATQRNANCITETAPGIGQSGCGRAVRNKNANFADDKRSRLPVAPKQSAGGKARTYH